MTRLQLLPFTSAHFKLGHPPYMIVTAHPQRPFRPRYLFIDPTPSLFVNHIGIGADRGAAAGAGSVPAKLFELRGLGSVMADAQTLVDEMARAAYERKEAPHEIVIKVELPPEAVNGYWPLPLDLPLIMPGLVVTLGLSDRSTVESGVGVWERWVHVAMAGDVPPEPPAPRRRYPYPRLTGDAEIDDIIGGGK